MNWGCGVLNYTAEVAKKLLTEESLRALRREAENSSTTRSQRLAVRLARELDGKMALDCAVLQGGLIRVGDPVFLLED